MTNNLISSLDDGGSATPTRRSYDSDDPDDEFRQDAGVASCSAR